MPEFDRTDIYQMAAVVRNKEKNEAHYLNTFLGEIPLRHILKKDSAFIP